MWCHMLISSSEIMIFGSGSSLVHYFWRLDKCTKKQWNEQKAEDIEDISEWLFR